MNPYQQVFENYAVKNDKLQRALLDQRHIDAALIACVRQDDLSLEVKLELLKVRQTQIGEASKAVELEISQRSSTLGGHPGDLLAHWMVQILRLVRNQATANVLVLASLRREMEAQSGDEVTQHEDAPAFPVDAALTHTDKHVAPAQSRVEEQQRQINDDDVIDLDDPETVNAFLENIEAEAEAKDAVSKSPDGPVAPRRTKNKGTPS